MIAQTHQQQGEKKSWLQDKDFPHALVCWIIAASARSFKSGRLALICSVSTVYISALTQPVSGEIWEKGGRDYQEERESEKGYNNRAWSSQVQLCFCWNGRAPVDKFSPSVEVLALQQ